MEWTNGFETATITAAERQLNDIPQWARAEHMEASIPLCELWKLSGEATGAKPEKKNILKKISTLSLFHSSYK